ncbi:hypothetical protein TAMA11512_22970 [Selenomonas sp. TAMA-11512]|uniref:hypothetical protein n=1 Tax=Selenomonas sp. TAMA-11512 TaxID=3095337 RepID=UPI0030896A66|nr:hypothetical protein TAMA11512_22970 [Selenomonas sp. TAMA-11512]
MSWVKNGLLLAAGGVIGLCVAVAMEAVSPDEQPSQTERVRSIRTMLNEVAHSMDETLKGLQPYTGE